MASEKKLSANRANARRSTGPKTAAGKLVVARNAIRHGIFAHIPVVPGESPFHWDKHREGVVAALGPVGLLEQTLAERAALLLWRLARLARYESAIITAGIEDAGLPPIWADPFATALHPPTQTADTHLKLTDQNLRLARKNHAEVLATADVLRGIGEPARPETFRADLAETVLNWADDVASEYPLRRFNPGHPGSPAFMEHLGLTGQKIKQVDWTPELLASGLAYFAEATGEAPVEFRAHVQQVIDARVSALAREVNWLTGDVAAIVRRSESGRARAGDEALLTPEQVAERLMKYEKHLHAILISTMHELERLQARRGGAAVLPPVVADLHITSVTGAG